MEYLQKIPNEIIRDVEIWKKEVESKLKVMNEKISKNELPYDLL